MTVLQWIRRWTWVGVLGVCIALSGHTPRDGGFWLFLIVVPVFVYWALKGETERSNDDIDTAIWDTMRGKKRKKGFKALQETKKLYNEDLPLPKNDVQIEPEKEDDETV